MTSKEKAGKHQSKVRRSGRTRQFAKDWKRLAKSGRYPMKELKDVMELLIENNAPLPAEYNDPLAGRLERPSGIATSVATGS